MLAAPYTALADFLASWFHQDFDIEGETVAEVVTAYKASSSAAAQTRLRQEIEAFLRDHDDELDEAFENVFHPDIIASALSGSTRGFLEEVRDLLGSA